MFGNLYVIMYLILWEGTNFVLQIWTPIIFEGGSKKCLRGSHNFSKIKFLWVQNLIFRKIWTGGSKFRGVQICHDRLDLVPIASSPGSLPPPFFMCAHIKKKKKKKEEEESLGTRLGSYT